LFEKLRSAIGKFVSSLSEKLKTRELGERELEEALESLKLSLVESDVAYEAAERLAEEVKKELLGRRVDRALSAEGVVREALKKLVSESYPREAPDVFCEAKEKCYARRRPYVVVFFGVNGTGKTTTIAKMAYAFKERGLTPVIVAADTFRAGAQEQLEGHAKKLGVPIVKAKYGSDPAAVVLDAISFAASRNYCVVLVDTAGRMHTDADLMEELRKIVRVAEPDLKILVLDALAGNDALEQARRFSKAVGVDAFILTKVDADAKGGAALSVVLETGRPILFVGTGQRYEDLKPFSVDWLLEKILRGEE